MSQEFDKNKLDLVKQKWFYPYGIMTDLENFKEKLSCKERFYSSLTNRIINDKECEHVFNVWGKLEMKKMKDHHNLYLKWDALWLADVSEQIRNNSWKNYEQ